MGKGKPCWQHVQTPEDRDQIELFKKVYEQGIRHRGVIGEQIPKILHFIWVGPKEFPKTSKFNVETWAKLHPGWRIKFWTDRIRPLPHPRMELIQISSSDFQTLADFYAESTNYAEKSDLLRYEILRKEGGIYADHDVVCMQNFDELIQKHQFFCALEPPHKPLANSSISICNNLIGSIPHHPIIGKCIDKVINRWNIISKMYPGNDQESVIYRVFHRTFCPFDEAVTEGMNAQNYRNMVFPAGYFNRIDGAFGFFANHEYLGTWYKTEDPYELLMRRRLMKMSKKLNKILLICACSVGLNMLMGMGVFVFLRRKYVR